jgi:hypothetical protein
MDIIERAARAIVTRNWPSLCEADVSEMWSCHVKDARAVLEALREPDEGMLKVAYLADENELTAYDSWQAMIDQALKG